MTRAEAFTGMRVHLDDRKELVTRGQEPVPGLKQLGKPDYSRSIAMLGARVIESGRAYNHWLSKGVYPFGSRGSRAQPPMQIAGEIVGELKNMVPGMNRWSLTDTTAKGFSKVFTQKVDTTPIENHKYQEYLKGVYDSIAARTPKICKLSDGEIVLQANKQEPLGQRTPQKI